MARGVPVTVQGAISQFGSSLNKAHVSAKSAQSSVEDPQLIELPTDEGKSGEERESSETGESAVAFAEQVEDCLGDVGDLTARVDVLKSDISKLSDSPAVKLASSQASQKSQRHSYLDDSLCFG